MKKNEAISQLKTLIEEGEAVLATAYVSEIVIGGYYVKSEVYTPWQADALILLRQILPPNMQGKIDQLDNDRSNHVTLAEEWQGQLNAALHAIERGIIQIDDDSSNADTIITRMLTGFPEVADSLMRRYNNRGGFIINDEYDVQDLLRSICLAYFDDVRTEEPIPSFAGRSSRIDLFLKDEERFIEVKHAGPKLRDNKLGEQLSVDIPQYKGHPGCKHLFCFIYDPGRCIKNPIGLVKDLESVDPGFVSVIVAR